MKLMHKQLCEIGKLYLINSRQCNPVFIEKGSAKLSEFPDVIGWNSSECIVIECKTSMQDYYADLKKPHREEGGLGNLRYYLVPEEMQNIDPCNGWGLLVARHANVRPEMIRGKNSLEFKRTHEKEVLFMRSRIMEIQRFGC